MVKKGENLHYGNELASWNVPEYEYHERNRLWYIFAITISLLFMVFAFLTQNFLFAVIIIIAALVIILNDGQKPMNVKFIITDEGILVGRKFYDYDDIKDFSIVYKPRLGVRNIYFEFIGITQPRITIDLKDENPLQIREILLKYLSEDLERTDEPLSEILGRFFKI